MRISRAQLVLSALLWIAALGLTGCTAGGKETRDPAGLSSPPSSPARASAPASPSSSATAPAAYVPPAGSDPVPLKFSELYSGGNARLGLEISPKVQALNGHKVRMTGFMAPPLKPSLNFFVLTKVPMSICPFCSTDADWPDDIILVLVKQKQDAVIYTTPIQVIGTLEIGGKSDPQTGFYSIMRIYAETVKESK